MRGLALSVLVFLAACGQTGIDIPTRAAAPELQALPPMKAFTGAPNLNMRTRSNDDLVRDFLDLSFQMESGRDLPILTRFETPITVAFATEVPDQLIRDLDQLLTRLQREAGIRISRIGQTANANIVIETLPKRKLRAAVPHAACFVVPNVTSWDGFRKNRRGGALDWSKLDSRRHAAIFIPDDISPQEARDCLHEELAQSLGPLNDMYRLAESIFNDDNIHTVLTQSDMLLLRAYYDPGLKNGMTRDEAAAALPAIFARLHPEGTGIPARGDPDTTRHWIDTIERAIGPGISNARRVMQARNAVKMARDAGWTDNRLGFSLYMLGRLTLGNDGPTAIDAFRRAYDLFRDLYGTDDIHTAHVALQLAAFSLSRGDTEQAISFVNDSLPATHRAENAALLAMLLLVKAEALEVEGRLAEARAVRLDSLGWARYGFASEKDILARLNEISSLAPQTERPGVL